MCRNGYGDDPPYVLDHPDYPDPPICEEDRNHTFIGEGGKCIACGRTRKEVKDGTGIPEG